MKKTHERAILFARKKADSNKEYQHYKEDQECEVILPYIKERLKFFEAQSSQDRDIPLDIFPGIFGKYAKEYYKVYQHPNNYIFGAMLSAISTVIGMSVVLHTKKYKNTAAFYGMLIGKSGSAKTHPMEYFLSPIIEIEREITKKYAVDYNRWKRNETSNTPKSTKEGLYSSKSCTVRGKNAYETHHTIQPRKPKKRTDQHQ